MKPRGRFWVLAEAVRKASSPYEIDYRRAKRVLSRFGTHELMNFRAELECRVRDLARWDQWSVGALLDGYAQ